MRPKRAKRSNATRKDSTGKVSSTRSHNRGGDDSGRSGVSRLAKSPTHDEDNNEEAKENNSSVAKADGFYHELQDDRRDAMRFPQLKSYTSLVRPTREAQPMSATKRFWMRLQRWFRFKGNDKKERSQHRFGNQYRIPPREEKISIISFCTRFLENSVESLTVWLHQSSFVVIIMIYLVLYLLIIIFFALCLHATIVGAFRTSNGAAFCCSGFDFDVLDYGNNFQTTLELSWTTLSTVGYGSVAVPREEDCEGTRYLLAIEAFVGVIYSGMCGAIFYSKIQRLHTSAHVSFSSAVCCLFGAGITDAKIQFVASDEFENEAMTERWGESFENISSERDDEIYDNDAVTNFPVIEMRCVNDRANAGGSEIVDAELTCTAAMIDEYSEADLQLTDDSLKDLDDKYGVSLARDTLHHSKDGSRSTIKKRSFKAMVITPQYHPYFSKGVWYFRHVLNHRSPLIKKSVRRRILHMKGWPVDLNTPEKVRESFSEGIEAIHIALRGKSNLTADEVFKTHIYYPSDCYIGWTFAAMVYVTNKNKHRLGHFNDRFEIDVDLSLLHDIIPQEGGYCEPLGSRMHQS